MDKLLTTRLSVLGRNRLKTAFCSALIFVLKGAQNIPEERKIDLISEVEKFAEKTGVYIRFREFNLPKESLSLWWGCLSGGVYAFQELENKLEEVMLPLTKGNETTLAALWRAFAEIYARQLLLLGGQTICAPEHQFNQETVRHFITYPNTVHGAEIINDIPPLLEKGYIYLNRCGEDQKTGWHRDTFMDSYFLALMSYRDIIAENELKRIFRINNRELAEN